MTYRDFYSIGTIANYIYIRFRLPFPWLLYTIVFQTHVVVSSSGAACSIGMLFLMLILVFLAILFFQWSMTKEMGYAMLILYVIFVIVSLGFSFEWYTCPV